MHLLNSRELLLQSFSALSLLVVTTIAQNSSSSCSEPTAYLPVSFSIGNSPSIDGPLSRLDANVVLDAANPILTLDYGAEVAGFPFIEIASVSGDDAQIKMTYSEPFAGLSNDDGDGPCLTRTVYPILSAQSNSQFPHLEQRNPFSSSREDAAPAFLYCCRANSLSRGGQRWQSVTLLTNSTLAISSVGFRPSVNIQPLECLPGTFSASNSGYDAVWGLGARAVQAACVPANSQPSTWEITPEGALIRGQAPAVSAKGLGFSDYEVSFSTKIVRGGTGWRVGASANSGYGAYFVITTGTETLQTGEINLPLNTLTAGYGFSIISTAIVPASAPVQQFALPEPLLENSWYRITTSIQSNGYNISVNGTPIAFVSSDPFQPYINLGWGTAATNEGSWGFGPFLDQSAYFTDVEAVSQDGTVLYNDSLTSTDILNEYRVASNSRDFCLDGAKRDREVWVGDFAHTTRELAASTGAYNYIESVIEFELEWQLTTGDGAGLIPEQSLMGDGYQFRELYYPQQYGETDYQFFFLMTIGDYYALTSNTTIISKYWSNITALVETLIVRYLDPYSGLMAGGDSAWFTAQGTQNATAPTALFVVALNQLVHVANAVGDYVSAEKYSSLAANISAATNQLLWSPSLGIYPFSLEYPSTPAILATAFAIRSGIANTAQATSSIEALGQLFYQLGYKDTSLVDNNGGTLLSPNTQGFLLESLFIAHTKLNVSADVVVPVISNLLDIYWPTMVNQNEFSTGAPWEYADASGQPGLGLFTSLSHPWGGAPTYVLTDYILGVRREITAAGVYEWVFEPAWDIVEGLNLSWVQGTVPLYGGGQIEASWSIDYENNRQLTSNVVGRENITGSCQGCEFSNLRT